MLQREEQNAYANQDPGRHTAGDSFQRDELRRDTRPHNNPYRYHRIEVGWCGVVANPERHRHPKHQQKTQRHARAQNVLVPIRRSEFSPLCHSTRQALKKLAVIGLKRQD